MGVSGQRHALAALYPQGKNHRYPLVRRLGGPQSWSGHRGHRKNLFLCRESNRGRPVCSKTLLSLVWICNIIYIFLNYFLSTQSWFKLCICADHHHHHHWLDSPTWALRSFCQLSFSIATFLQFFTPKVLISWITSSSHLSLVFQFSLFLLAWC
jgi:hypothetical protein